jgi:Fic family protein
LLQELIAYLRKDDGLPVILRLALVHYQFETIHPFNDGNGRLGRLLIPMLLCQQGVLSTPLLYLSAYFEKHRQQYYDRLLEVSRHGEWMKWIEFFAAGVAEQAFDAAKRARRLLELAAAYRKRLSETARWAAAIPLVDLILERPFLTIPSSKETTNASFKSTSRQVALLVKLGILREVTGKKRNRVFVADNVLRLLEESLD